LEWAIERVETWVSSGDLDVAWQLIEALLREVPADDVTMIANVGAGPLENALVTFGDAAMDRVERASDANPALLKALAMVWRWDVPIRPRIDHFLAERRQELL
jgi:hypothetical protein